MRRVFSLVCVLVVAAAAVAFAAPVKISWWHIGVNPPDKSVYQSVVDGYLKLHPDVTIEMTILENEAFKAKTSTLMQSGNPPDVFQSWGGGLMSTYAAAGLLRDISKEVLGTAWGNSMAPGVLGVYQYNGKQYGMPYDMGAVSFWYNKALLAKVGYKTFPATWPDLLTLVSKLKAAGITPIALGAGDKWPAHFWWSYLAIRLGGKPVFQNVLSGKGKLQ